MNGASAQRLSFAMLDLCVLGEPTLPADREWLENAAQSIGKKDRYAFWQNEVARLRSVGVTVIPSSSAEYPANLGLIHDQPPLLFIRGTLERTDHRSVAIVGTRTASPEGLGAATRLATELVGKGVTIISGLAKGIDTAAHLAALDAGGRTIAVFGTPITRVYPAENKALAARVERSGACVSQFLPTKSTGPWSFPIRNITTSGLSLGTVVVEAGATSGARLQAEAALAHGKRVFLLRKLVTGQPWARDMAQLPNVTVAKSTNDVVDAIDLMLAPMSGALL